MKYVRLSADNRVVEIIPEFNPAFPDVPINKRYSRSFIDSLIAVDDGIELDEGWVYDVASGAFINPENPEQTTAERVTTLEAENKLLTQQVEALSGQNDFLEECIVEMAGVVYA